MTKITQIIDQLNTTLNTIYGSTHKQLYDPRIPGLNDTKILNRGFGFYIAEGNNTNRQLSCELSIERSIIVTNTIVTRGTERDLAIRLAAEKQLFEDQLLLIKEVEMNTSLELLGRFKYLNDNGSESVFADQNDYLMINTTFTMEYFESLT